VRARGVGISGTSLRRRWRRSCAAALVAVAAAVPACGKKGPPLAPLVRLPAAVDVVSARRLDNTVYLQFVVPDRNQDHSTPGDVARVDVFGYTGTPDSDADIVKYGTLVASVPVRRPPPPDQEREPKNAAGSAGRERSAPSAEPGIDQGAMATVTETLTPAAVKPVVKPARKGLAPASPWDMGPLPAVRVDEVPARFYIAVAVNHKNHRGTLSRRVGVPVIGPPPPPVGLELAYSATQITLGWTPPSGAPAAGSRDRAPGSEGGVRLLVPRRSSLFAHPGWSYNVYEVSPAPPADAGRPVAFAGGTGSGVHGAPQPLNPKPLERPEFADGRLEFGTERCYAVRTVMTFGALQQESPLSAPACITPRDIFPPASPRGLTAVAGPGAISLIWEPNAEADLGGYLVLRGEVPGVTLQPITRDPIQETTFNDTTVKPGVRYVYAIVALDKATPPNVSAQSNRVEETAR
jgi:hypothetical protein